MNDPLLLKLQRGGDSCMDLHDFELLGKLLNERYLERPALTVNVGFCFGNPGKADQYQVLTKAVTTAWAKAFASGGEYGCVGIQWGSIMVFVAACNTGARWASPSFGKAFANLKERIEKGLEVAKRLNVAPRSKVTLYDGRRSSRALRRA
jgi:hypothetical protein